MELHLFRYLLLDGCTIGKLYHEDDLICHTLEDKDRGLKQEWELATIVAKKEYGKTAIPLGRYEIAITMSNRFKRALPLLMNVKGFEGIRIHPGNTAEDTEGCLLVGEHALEEDNFIINSRATFVKVFKLIGDAMLNEKVFITIDKLSINV